MRKETVIASAAVVASSLSLGFSLIFADRPDKVDQSIRDRPEVRRAMDGYRKTHPTCEWCGGTPIEVHHCISLWLDPSLAADTNNFVSLCKKDHIRVGHAGSFGGRCVTNVKAVCAMHIVVERKGQP